MIIIPFALCNKNAYFVSCLQFENCSSKYGMSYSFFIYNTLAYSDSIF